MPAVAQPAAGGPIQQQQQQPTLFSTADRSDVVPLIQKVEGLRGSRVITYYLHPGIHMAMDAIPCFYEQLRTVGKQDKIDLWLHSSGGQTEFPWRLVQMVRQHCKTFSVLVPELAQSAATHVALGADEIVGGPFTLLSPVDPYRQHPLLPKGVDLLDPSAEDKPFPVSVQDLKHAVAFVKREAGEGGLSSEAFATVVSALFEKVHPLAIGAIEQSYELSKLITRRMLSMHMDEDADADEIERLTNALCDDYKSHNFPIGVTEAERLGLKVTMAPDDLHEAMWELLEYYSAIDRSLQVVPSAAQGQLAGVPINGQAMKNSIGHVDSTDVRFDCNQIVDVTTSGSEVRGSAWLRLDPAQPAPSTGSP
jgi:hypothetical protein